MIEVSVLDTSNRSQVSEFIEFPFRLYSKSNQWVPPIRNDVSMMLNPKKHPFYEHSLAQFFIAKRDQRVVGRLGVLLNRSYNDYHKTKKAQFYLFDCEDDLEVTQSLFERGDDWAHRQGMVEMVGPKGFGPLDGYGILVEGFEHRQMMNMMNYNSPYYAKLLEAIGFEKEVDFVSAFISQEDFQIPDRVHRITERARQRSDLEVKRFESKRELVRWSKRIGKTYNEAFVNNWEYYPLTEREISFVVDNIMLVADPKLIKIITHHEDVVGFLFAFPDVSAAMQRIKGRLFPFGIFDLLMEMRRTEWVALNGAGILPEFQGKGGNALLYTEMEKTIKGTRFKYADLTQVAETALQMRSDLINLGGKPYKNHRVYRRRL